MADPTSIEIEEYKSLRDQIKFNIEYMEQNERNSIIAAAAIYTAIFIKNEVNGALAVGMCIIPLLVFAIGFVKYRALDEVIGTVNDYIERIEEKYPQIRWTKFYRAERSGTLKYSRDLFWRYTMIGSAVLFVLFSIFTFCGNHK